MKLSKIVSSRTNDLLKEHNMSKYKLARITCLTEKTIANITKESTNDINISTLYLISSAFNMDILEFLAPDEFRNNNVEF